MTTGDWRSYFTQEQSARLDALYQTELGGSGLLFDYGACLIMCDVL